MGGGILRREIRVAATGEVVRYNLAYINPLSCSADRGRGLGYDNADGEHHRHHMGMTEPVIFVGFAQIERRFQAEWQAQINVRQHAKN